MVTWSGDRLSVTSWGEVNIEYTYGPPTTFRLWRIRLDGELVAELAVPHDLTVGDVSSLAYRMYLQDGDQ
jgi:hypothetical protein